MAVAFVTQITPWTSGSPAASGSFTPTAGNCLAGYIVDGSANSRTLSMSGTGTYLATGAVGNFNDTNNDTHAAWSNLSCSAGAQTSTVSGTAADTMIGWLWQYSGVSSIGTSSAVNRAAPGATVTGTAVVVAAGDMLFAVCVDVTGGNPTFTSTGTLRGNAQVGGIITYAAAEYAGTGASVTPSFGTSLSGDNYVVMQWVMKAAASSSPAPSATSKPGVGPNPLIPPRPQANILIVPATVLAFSPVSKPGLGPKPLIVFRPQDAVPAVITFPLAFSPTSKPGRGPNPLIVYRYQDATPAVPVFPLAFSPTSRPGLGPNPLIVRVAQGILSTGANVTILPGKGHLTLTGYAPTIIQTHNQVILPGVGHLVITGHVPGVAQSGNKVVVPVTGHLVLTGHVPGIAQTHNQVIVPVTGHLILSGHTPVLVITHNQLILPGKGHLQLTGYAPAINPVGPSGSGGEIIIRLRRRRVGR